MENKFPIAILGERIFSNSQKAMEVANSRNLGEKLNGKVLYSSFEALYLIESGKAELIDVKTNKKISEERLLARFSKKNRDFLIKYLVFKKLKQKGYIVKTGSKFGAEFRVYENNMNNHAKWLVYPVKQSEKHNWDDFISKNRVSHSTGKKLLLAIVDSEDNVLFYEASWMRI